MSRAPTPNNRRVEHEAQLLRCLGTVMRAARRQSKIKHEGMAQHLGVSPAAVTSWETGLHRPPIGHLYLWGRHCGLPLSEMFRLVEKHLPGMIEADTVATRLAQDVAATRLKEAGKPA